MSDDRSEIDLVKDSLDIVDVIRHTVALTDAGNGQYVGATSTGSKSGKSLNVDRNQQLFNDWGSGAKGDVLNWIAFVENLDIAANFPAVLEAAAKEAGITLNKSNYKFNADAQKVYTTTTAITEHYHNCLTDEHRKYITEKWGITDKTINRLHIGFAPLDENLIKVFKETFSADEILKTGFLIKTRDGIKSFYQGRIIFPYWKNGKVVYSIARKTEWTPENEFEKSKYKKQLMRKDNRQYISDIISNKYFYGVDSIRGRDYCIVTEGITDCIMAIQSGEPCISPVTIQFKKNEIETAASLVENMKNVVICNDNDESGNKGTVNTADYFDKKGISVRIINLPLPIEDTKIDLAEYIKSHSNEELKTLIKNSVPLVVARLNAIEVSNEPLDNLSTATEFITGNLSEKDIVYKTAFIETHIKKHFNFSSKIINQLLSKMKADIKERTIKEKYDIRESAAIETNEAIPEDIMDAAREIIYTGDPVKMLLDTHASMHVGDEPLARALLVSIGIQSVLNSDGIHPKVSGDSGKGKTHCCKAMMHLLPEKYKFNTTLSDRAIYYMNIPEGAVVFSDDIDLSETLEGIIKRSTSNFQEGDNYTTLDKNLNVKELYIPPRISWWLTSVDDNQSLQLLNRQFGGSVDETETQDDAVFEFQRNKMKTGIAGLPENSDVQICRCIVDDIKKQLYTVVIPFADDIDWIDKSNRRNFLIFGDIIQAFAVLRHRQRYKTVDNELIASIEDYNDAKELYIGRAKNQGMKLTDVELKFCNILNNSGEMDYNQLQTAMGVSQGRISQIINGKEKVDSGLVNKVPGLIIEKRSVRTNDTIVQKKVCSLRNFNQFDNYEAVVTLKEGAEDTFLRHYPPITRVLPSKNITPLTDITSINKYIIYTREQNGNIESVEKNDVENNSLSVISEKQGNKVIPPLPIAKTGGKKWRNLHDNEPESNMPQVDQQQIMEYINKEIQTYTPANHEFAVESTATYLSREYGLTNDQAKQYISKVFEDNGFRAIKEV